MKKFSLAALLLATPLYAQDKKPEITIYGSSHVGVEASKVGSSVSLLTAEDIEERGVKLLADALRSLPSVQVNSSGGGLSQVRIRGAEGKHALVIVDGVIFNDVGQGEAYLDNFPVGDIERIEVVRGPQSGVHGAQAHAGAILITTKSGKGFRRPELEASFEHGSLNTQRINLSARGAKDNIYGAITLQAHRTDGYNSAKIGSEKDGNSAFTFTNKIGAEINERLSVEAFIRHHERNEKYDGQPWNPLGYDEVVDGNYYAAVKSSMARLSATYKAYQGRWVHNFSTDINVEDRKNYENNAPYFSNNGKRVGFTYKNAFKFDAIGAKHTFVSGVDSKSETYKYTDTYVGNEWLEGKTRARQGIFAEHLVDFNQGTSLTSAVRYDVNTVFANILTYRLAASHNFNTGTRLHTSFGKGSTNPSFFQQYGYQPSNFVGNASIKPEQSHGFDFGIEQKWMGGQLITDVTYYNLRLSDALQSVYNAMWQETVINSTKVLHRQGVELAASYLATNWLTLNGSYAYFEGKDATGQLPTRRPNHAASFSATAKFMQDKGRFTLSLNHNGRMREALFNNTTWGVDSVSLKPFRLLNAQVSYDVTKNATVYLRGENLLNTKYEEVYSYRGSPMQIYGGVKVKM